MGLHSYLVEPYKYTHEREAFHVIEEQLKNYANEKGEDILLIGNLSCNNEPLDAVIFKRDAITVIEFKDYGGKIVFQENGPWHSEDGTEIKGGSHGNPFRQLRDYKMALVKYLAQKNIFNSVDLGHISGLLFFQRNILFDSETIPGKIKPWFAICDIRNFILKVDQRTSIDINISEIEFQLIEKKLNLRSSKKSDNKDSRQNPSLNSIVSELHNYQHVKELLGKATYIGIDFGTSTTVLSYVYFDENRNSINTRQIPMPFEINGATEENEILPTVIYFDKNLNKIDICDAAKLKKYDGIYGVNYWSSFKMQLGKDEGSSFIDSQLKDNNAIEKILNNKDATRVFFKYLANFAKSYLNNKGVPSDYKFCVSIPASFEANQRQDLYEAIKDAGIEVDSNMFIDEPNAAFLSYLTTEQSNFLPSFHKTFTIVFDFGAGTCDISIIELGEKKDGYYSRNIAISKFEEIGGDNLDDLIARNILFPSLCISAS